MKVAAVVDALKVGLWTAREVLLTLMTCVMADEAEATGAEADIEADEVTAAELGAGVAYIEADEGVGVASASNG